MSNNLTTGERLDRIENLLIQAGELHKQTARSISAIAKLSMQNERRISTLLDVMVRRSGNGKAVTR